MDKSRTARKPLTISGLLNELGNLSVVEVVLVIGIAVVFSWVVLWTTQNTLPLVAPADADEVSAVRRLSVISDAVPAALISIAAGKPESLTHGDYVNVVLAATLACRKIPTPTPIVQDACGEALARAEYVRRGKAR